MSTSDDLRPAVATYQTQISDTDTLLRSLIGSAVLLLAADFAEPVFFGEGFYSSLSVHPYWIIVILAAVQSGLYVGVAIAGLAALLMDWPTRQFGVSITSHYIDTAILPLQWLITALAIGVFRQGQLREETRLRHENARLAHMSERMSSEVMRLDAALARSELAAVTRPGVPTNQHIDHIIAYLSRLAEASRRQSGNSEPLPIHPVALLIEGPEGQFLVSGDGVDPWFPAGEVAESHSVVQALKGLERGAIVPTKDGSFVCSSLPRCGTQQAHGALVAMLHDETRTDDVTAWLGLLAPLVSVALIEDDEQTAALDDPDVQTAASLPYLLKNALN
jgi:hypothetical protein